MGRSHGQDLIRHERGYEEHILLGVLEHVGRLLDVFQHLRGASRQVPLVQLAAQRRVEAERKLQARLRGRQLPCCSERSSGEEHAPFQ